MFQFEAECPISVRFRRSWPFNSGMYNYSCRGVTFNPHFVFLNLNPPYLFIYFLYPQTYIDLPDGNNFWIVMTVAPPNTYENKVITANTTPDVPYKKI